ncbi:hypothetical protein [Mucilaginibacter pineti]|uniref:hypothetical protein n=1 Tax=Mucilaginibacter pineti TaxID=1391627 RepID=UPI0013BE9278|nr:hypothetical protein [Mucilaginibacter pineti]
MENEKYSQYGADQAVYDLPYFTKRFSVSEEEIKMAIIEIHIVVVAKRIRLNHAKMSN